MLRSSPFLKQGRIIESTWFPEVTTIEKPGNLQNQKEETRNLEYNSKKEKWGVEKVHFSGNHLRLWVSLKLLRVSKYPSTLQFYLEITFVSGLSSRIDLSEVLFFVCPFQINTKEKSFHN